MAIGLIAKLRGSYAIALILIGMLATTSYFLLNSVISSNNQKEALIEIAVAQQMLTQRIMLNSTEAHTADAPWPRIQAEQNLRRALASLLQNHSLLRHGSTDHASPLHNLRLSAEAVALFEDAPGQLDHSTETLAATVEALLASLPSVASAGNATDALTALTGLKLYVVEKVRREYETLTHLLSQEAEATETVVEEIHLLVFLATIALLFVEALLIFQPLVRQVLQRTNELSDAHNAMKFAANHDGLTGLHNRAFLNDYLAETLACPRRGAAGIALIHIDLDRFKAINDTLGHRAGDAVLMEVSKRLLSSVRGADICARIGGDEFIVVLQDTATSKDAEVFAERICDALKRPFDFEGTSLRPGASIGMAIFPTDAATAEELILHADLALYDAKGEGRGRYRLFAPEMRAALDEKLGLEGALREAIATRAISVNYQPQVNLSDGKVVGVEALVRWNCGGKNIAPQAFLAVAEQAGLMQPLGRIVAEQAIAAAASWYRAGLDFGKLSLNTSPGELCEAGYADHLADTLRKEGLPTQRFSLEIAEAVFLDAETSEVANSLDRLARAGIRLDLDDFGNGYASLTHARVKEVSRLKLDQHFIRNIEQKPRNRQVVKAVVELARGLDVALVAKGVETESELRQLLDLGCPAVQGHGIAFPMAEDQMREWFAVHARPRAQEIARVAS